MQELAEFFDVTVDYLRSENQNGVTTTAEGAKAMEYGGTTKSGNAMFLPELALNMKNNNVKMICTFETVVSEIKFVPLDE